MTRSSIRFSQLVLACVVVLGVTLPARAQFNRPIQIEDVRVGFPSSALDLYKVGKWVPVLVIIGPPKEAGGVLPAEFKGKIEIETRDGDGWNTHIVKDNVVLTKDNPRGAFQGYTKLSEIGYQSLTVRLTGTMGTADINLSFTYPSQERARLTNSRSEVDHGEQLIVNIGNAYGFTAEQPDQGVSGRNNNTQTQQVRRAASPNRIFELPDHWYGYESVDAVVLSTGGTYNNSLVQQLARDPVKRDALERWVLQGGHLIVSVAGNAAVIGSPNDFPLEPILPVRIDRTGLNKSERLDGLRDFLQTIPSSVRQSEGEIRGPEVQTARLEPKPGLTTFTAAMISDYTKRPLVIRAPYGLGKVTVIGFDTNSESFQSWAHKHDFWGAVLESRTVNTNQNQFGYYGREDASLAMANRIEEFGDVPVISFAVVAFFIAIYIILIGPVDYFVLKKVFKRLEYTWFTFPTVVLLVSLAAYFGAYYLKGDKLRINKVDLVELDLTHQRAAGMSWLAIFSPRLVNYNIDLTPQGVTVPAGSPAVTMSWLGRFGSGARSIGQAQGGLFERNYFYTPDASGLRNLPIQVWSQKSLEARWVASLDASQQPIENSLTKDRAASIKGKIKSKLPRPLLGAKLLFGDKVWEIGTMQPDKSYDLDDLNQQSLSFSQVLTRHLAITGQPDFAGDLNRLIFNSRQTNESSGREMSNEYLRQLNQSWRLKDYGEAILIGTFQDEYGDAVGLNQGGTFGTKLKLTGSSGNDLLTGSLRQATVLRMYIPVKEAAARTQ